MALSAVLDPSRELHLMKAAADLNPYDQAISAWYIPAQMQKYVKKF